MAGNDGFIDWTDLKTQAHWFKLRREFEGQIRAATADTRRQYEVRIRLNTATIVSDDGRSVLRVPVSAMWRDDLEQTIAALLVASSDEHEPRIAAIAHGINDLLQRWIQHEVPVGASPEFLYPEPDVRWPDMPESSDATAAAVKQATAQGARAENASG